VSSGFRARPLSARVGAVRPTGLIGIGAVVVTVATMGAATIPATHDGWRFGVVTVVLGVFAALVPDRLAVAWAGALAWLLVNGFLVDRFGELSWHGRGDLYRALMLVAAAAVGLVSGQAVRLWSAWRWQRLIDDEWRAIAQEFGQFNQFDEEETRDA
jgi:hypothetical protein